MCQRIAESMPGNTTGRTPSSHSGFDSASSGLHAPLPLSLQRHATCNSAGAAQTSALLQLSICTVGSQTSIQHRLLAFRSILYLQNRVLVPCSVQQVPDSGVHFCLQGPACMHLHISAHDGQPVVNSIPLLQAQRFALHFCLQEVIIVVC